MDNHNENMDNYTPQSPDSYLPQLPSGNDPFFLPELEGWNWGAFLLNWLWLLNVSSIWGVVLLIVTFMSCGLFAVAPAIYLGLKGNEVAWKYRTFKSVEDFHAVQRAWARWALIFFAAVLAMVIFMVAVISLCRNSGSL